MTWATMKPLLMIVRLINMFKIQDWAGNECFMGKTFTTFDEAEEFLEITLDSSYDTDRQEYEIYEVLS